MTTRSRFAIAAAFCAVAAVACSSAPGTDEPASVGVQADQVSPDCVRGGGLCGVTGATQGTGAFHRLGGLQLETSDLPPPPPDPPPSASYPPTSCGACKVSADGAGCSCPIGNGFDFVSTITCPYFAPCRRLVLGSFRCYDAMYCP